MERESGTLVAAPVYCFACLVLPPSIAGQCSLAVALRRGCFLLHDHDLPSWGIAANQRGCLHQGELVFGGLHERPRPLVSPPGTQKHCRRYQRVGKVGLALQATCSTTELHRLREFCMNRLGDVSAHPHEPAIAVGPGGVLWRDRAFRHRARVDLGFPFLPACPACGSGKMRLRWRTSDYKRHACYRCTACGKVEQTRIYLSETELG